MDVFAHKKITPKSAYRTLQNESLTLLGELFCIEMIPGILICRWKITPTHHALRPDRKGMYANLELFSDISKWFREFLSDSHTSDTVSSIVNVCIAHAILWTKTGNPLIIKWEISSSVNHMWQNISRLVTKGDSYHNMMKFLQECLSHIAKWLSHTHLLLGSSHVIWHISAGYRRGLYHNMMKQLRECLSHVVKWLAHTHMVYHSMI